MKKQIYLLLLFQLLADVLFCQNMEIVWQQCYGGSNDEEPMDILPIKGGYYIVGGTYSNDGNISFSHGNSEAWLLKIDSVGNIIWEKTYGGSNGEFWRRIFPAPGNCYYLIGASGSWDGDISYDPYPGSNDLWVAKIDSIGGLIWEKIIGGGLIDMVESGTLTNDGGVVVFGWTGSQNGDVSINFGMYDMWLVKLNSNGDIEWDKSFGTDDFDYGNTIIQTSDGGFLIGGTSIIGNNGNLICLPHSINAEAIIMKLSPTGDIEWQNCYGGTEHDGVFGLLEISDGYIISAYADSNDGDVTGHHGESDVWLIQIDFLGNIIWEHCYGGYKIDIAHHIFEKDNGDLVVLGQTNSNDGDVNGNHSLSEFDNDIWMINISNEGELLWQKCYGGEGSESLGGVRYGIAKKNDNNFIIAALTDYGPSYDVGCTPHGGLLDEDYWVFEIDSLDTTGVIEKHYENETVKVFPNPANEYVEFNVQSSRFIVGSDIRVSSLMGEEVARLTVKGERTEWDCRHLPPGIYFYQLQINDKSYTGKFLIIK